MTTSEQKIDQILAAISKLELEACAFNGKICGELNLINEKMAAGRASNIEAHKSTQGTLLNFRSDMESIRRDVTANTNDIARFKNMLRGAKVAGATYGTIGGAIMTALAYFGIKT